MKLIVAGSRDFKNYKLLKEKLDHFLKDIKEPIEIVCGEAAGADALGKKYAIERGYHVKSFPAKWDDMREPCILKINRYGKSYNALAGTKRNNQMGNYGTHGVFFWDRKSPGTRDMIEIARSKGLPLKFVYF